MDIPTEPIGSIPRPENLIHGIRAFQLGRLSESDLDFLYEEALEDTIRKFEETGSPVITDGEQSKPSFATYPVHGLENLAPDGITIPFKDGHVRRLPRLTSGPFYYLTHADAYLAEAKKRTSLPVKQAVISASALSLLYPQEGIPGYSRKDFLRDLVNEAEADIRLCLDKGAHSVQIDFTEGRLALKLDPSGGVLKEFIRLNNNVLERFTEEERKKIGVHTCPGGDHDSTHSADVDYSALFPYLFELKVGGFYVELAGEEDRLRVLDQIKNSKTNGHRIFIGVTDPINPELETPEEVCDRILAASAYIDPEYLGTTDDCGFSPFGDDMSTARDTAFKKIKARVEGTKMAAEKF